MKKTGYTIITVILIVLVTLIISNIYLNDNKDNFYYLRGVIANGDGEITVQGFIMTNDNGRVVSYNVASNILDNNINYANLYYLDNDEKIIILGTSLNNYNYEKVNNISKDKLLNNLDNVYMDIYQEYSDLENNNPYKTLKLVVDKYN